MHSSLIRGSADLAYSDGIPEPPGRGNGHKERLENQKQWRLIGMKHKAYNEG